MDHSRRFFLKSEVAGDNILWFIKLLGVQKVQGKGLSINPHHYFRYFLSDVITEREFLRQGETGDIILLETDHIGAALQRKITGSEFGTYLFIYLLTVVARKPK